MRISDWSSDVCSSDLANLGLANAHGLSNYLAGDNEWENLLQRSPIANIDFMSAGPQPPSAAELLSSDRLQRSEEHTSELQSLMRISYAVFCLKKKKKKTRNKANKNDTPEKNRHKA